VYNFAVKYSSLWKLVALALSIPSDYISAVHKKESNSVRKCQEILQYWFDINGDESISLLNEILNQSFIQDELKLFGGAAGGGDYPDAFQSKIKGNYTEMIVKLTKILGKGAEYLSEILIRLKHYPHDIDTSCFENVKTIDDVFLILRKKELLSTIDISILKYLVKHIDCKEALNAIEEYEESIKDEPIAEELSWCMKQCQSPDRHFIYTRIKGNPLIVTYGDLKLAKETVSKYLQISESDLIVKRKGNGSVILFWDIPEELAKTIHLRRVVSVSTKQELSDANIIEIGICVKQSKSNIYVEEIAVSDTESKFYSMFCCY